MVQRHGSRGFLTIASAVLAAVVLVSGCKKKDESEEPLKLPEKKAEASATASAAASAAPTASAAASASPEPSGSAAAAAPSSSVAPTESATPEAASSGTPTNVGYANIDKCCTALGAIQSSGVSKETKTKAAAARLACNGIAQLVKTGKTSRAAALAQVRSALGGATAPAACN